MNYTSIKEIKSSDTNVSKFVFSSEHVVAEAVLYRYGSYEERTVICCSTQSGCPMGCRFCGAGDYFARSLTADEIVSQVDHLIEAKGISPALVKRGQIMFMSMGEPMLNYKNLDKAIRILAVKYPGWALLISTSAPDVKSYCDLFQTAAEIPAVGLQFSVHESTDEARDRLIPFKKKLSLESISAMGEMFYEATGRNPFFNYCAHEGNTESSDAARLLDLFNPRIWKATISVICERDESVAAANARQKQLADDFQAKLNEIGYCTRVFNPAGQDDIGGGCGQLWFVQDWIEKNPDKVCKSIGNGLKKVHTPI